VDMPSECPLLFASGGVPDPDGFLRASRNQFSCRDEPFAVRAERDATGTFTAIVRIVSTYLFAAGGIPEHHFLIAAARSEPLAVRTEGNSADAVLTVAAKRVQFLSGVRLPNANGCIVAHGNELLSVGTESNIVDRFEVALESVQEAPDSFLFLPLRS